MRIDYDQIGTDLMRRGWTFRRAERHYNGLRRLGDDTETLRKMLHALLGLLDADAGVQRDITDRWEEAGRWLDRITTS